MSEMPLRYLASRAQDSRQRLGGALYNRVRPTIVADGQ